MDVQKDIKKLVTYGLDKKLIMPEDEIYTINQYLELFRLDEYEDPDIEGEEIILPEILDRLARLPFLRLPLPAGVLLACCRPTAKIIKFAVPAFSIMLFLAHLIVHSLTCKITIRPLTASGDRQNT